MRLVQEQVKLLAHEIETQQRRDRVEAGPFFRIVENSFSNGVLTLILQNVGAAVICKEFRAITPGCHVREWHPSSLAPNDQFYAPTSLESPQQRECKFEMIVRDRWGGIRAFAITIDRTTAPHRIDFEELGLP